MLPHLKTNGFIQEELPNVYKTMISLFADYTCVVYHSGLTDEQDDLLYRLQNNALKCINGPGISACRIRESAGIST